jgi:hypothetical protein
VPIPFAPLVGFVLGVVLAWSAAVPLAREEGPVVASRPVAVAAAFALLVYTPVVGYFVAFHGDWAYVYQIPWRRVPSALDFALVLFSGACVLLGFLAAVPLLRKRRTGAVAALGVAPAAVALALLALTAKRLMYSATYAQFHGDFATEPVAASTLGYGILVMGVIVVAGMAWCVRAVWKMGSEARG